MTFLIYIFLIKKPLLIFMSKDSSEDFDVFKNFEPSIYIELNSVLINIFKLN